MSSAAMRPDIGSGALEVRNLTKAFASGGGMFAPAAKIVRAVNDVSFTIPKGMALGLVGESGCGKPTVARAVLRLIEPDSGAVTFDGADLRAARGANLRR